MATQNTGQPGDIVVATGDVRLEGILWIPDQPQGLVIFAHGSGSSRLSSRNQFVAKTLNGHRLATLLFDLLTSDENRIDERTRQLRFDIDLLTRRLTDVVDWADSQSRMGGLPIGLFGASTGAAAALRTAAQRSEIVSAVVSRGGRPDLAGDALAKVRCPTLLIVGGYDSQVIELNDQATRQLSCECQTEIVPGATHLFEEPGKLDEVARLASDWFTAKLAVT